MPVRVLAVKGRDGDIAIERSEGSDIRFASLRDAERLQDMLV